MKPNIDRDSCATRRSTQALQTIERRVNELGVAEPIVARHSAADQILVQLPGVTDVERAKEIIRSTALLELKLVERGRSPDESAALQAYGNKVPPDMQILPGRRGSRGAGAAAPSTTWCAGSPAVTGRDLRNARPTLDENNRPAVGFSLNSEGAAKFGAVHRREHRQAAGDRPRRPRLVGAAHRGPHRRRRPHHRQVHAAGSRRTWR